MDRTEEELVKLRKAMERLVNVNNTQHEQIEKLCLAGKNQTEIEVALRERIVALEERLEGVAYGKAVSDQFAFLGSEINSLQDKLGKFADGPIVATEFEYLKARIGIIERKVSIATESSDIDPKLPLDLNSSLSQPEEDSKKRAPLHGRGGYKN